MKHIAVIGAGISGLVCAYELQKAGYQVTVFEKESQVGGRMRTRKKDGLLFDIGADHLGGGSYKEMQNYCKELGVGWELIDNGKFAVVRDKKLYPAYKSVGFLTQLKLARFVKRLEKTTDFFDLSTAVDFDTNDAFTAISEQVNKEVAEYLANGLVNGYDFHHANEISSAALFAYLQSVKFEDWRIHHLDGGMSALPDALAKQLTVHTSSSVQSVDQENGILTVGDEEHHFDGIVMATTAPVTQRLLQTLTDEQESLLSQTEYAPTISLSFKLPKDALLDDFTVIFTPLIESKTISSYTNQKMKGPEMTADGMSMLSVWLHEEFANELMNLDDEEIFARVYKELIPLCPWLEDASKLTPHDLQRWQHAMPKFKQGHLTRVKAFLETHQGINNLFLCGDYLNSPWTEGAIQCGQRVATQVMNQLT